MQAHKSYYNENESKNREMYSKIDNIRSAPTSNNIIFLPQQYYKNSKQVTTAKTICNLPSVDRWKEQAAPTSHILLDSWYNQLRRESGYRQSSNATAITKLSQPMSPTASGSCPVNNCQGRSFCHFVALLTISLAVWHNCIGSVCGAPQSCVLCDKKDLKSKDPHNNYEEFLFEHQVTRMDAIYALKRLNETFYDASSGCAVICTETVMKYCLGPQFINDHCWCELGHTDEGLPFIPHICYVGEKVYTASVGSCYFYEEVKECCCAPALAKQWHHISVAAQQRDHNHLRLLNIVLVICCKIVMKLILSA